MKLVQGSAVQVGATVGPKVPSLHKTALEPEKPVAEQVSVQTAPEKTSESEQDEVKAFSSTPPLAT